MTTKLHGLIVGATGFRSIGSDADTTSARPVAVVRYVTDA